MIAVEETDSGLYVTDAAKNEVHIEIPDWEEGGELREINREVDRKISGFASELRFPESFVSVETEGLDSLRTYANETNDISIESGTHQIVISNSIYIYIKLKGSFSISRNVEDSRINIDFCDRTGITIGIRSRVRKPNSTIQTPSNPECLTKAISHLSTAFETTNPNRSYPSLRGYPPLLEIGDSLNIPETVKQRFSPSGIKIRIPGDLQYILIAAPLSYYLQANLVADGVNKPILEIPDEGIEKILSKRSQFEDDVVNLLRRVFWLDCLIRNEGPFKVNINELSLLDQLEIDENRLYSADLQERVASYLTCEFGSIDRKLPKWHLGTYVKPIENHISTIPHLLDRLSLIFMPKSRPADNEELLSYSLGGLQRSSRNHQKGSNSVRKAEPKIPDFQYARAFGWIADGYPVGVFKVIPDSFEHKFDFLHDSDREKKINVVLNDPEMEEEKSVVSQRYHDRAKDLSIDLTVYSNIEMNKLKTIFQEENDFVHYIGHCTESGLLCSDGYFSTANVENCQTKIFFLNACGSFEEGRSLIQNGSVSGVVTRNTILNQEATRVGATFGNLLVNGFAIEDSIRLARERSMANLEYFVIGDGTFRLSQADYMDPSYVTVNRTKSDQFKVTDMSNSIQLIGGCNGSYLSESGDYWLSGNPCEYRKDRGELVKLLESINAPVMFEDSYYWSDELSIKLQN